MYSTRRVEMMAGVALLTLLVIGTVLVLRPFIISLILAAVLLFFTWAWKGNFPTALAISISLIAVIIVAGIIGTFIPLFLHKRGIDYK